MLKKIWESLSIREDTAATLPAVVNYVWINDEKFAPEKYDPLCGVPLRYIDKALVNARKYPDAKFRIWADFSLLDGLSRYLLASHIYISGTDNIEICDLNDVPAYRDTPFFHADNILFEVTGVWARVDLARLLVLKHCADTMAPEAASVFYYSDFDVEDVMLDCPKAQNALRKYGLFLGTTERLAHEKVGAIENGFMAFHSSLSQSFLPKLIDRTFREINKGAPNGYGAFASTLFWFEIMNLFKGRRRHDYAAPRLRYMGYRIPDNPFYIENDIN